MAKSRVGSGRRRFARGRGDRGAALVEFALLALPLFTIIFGALEFSYAYYQNLDVRHGAREGSRLIAVNYNPSAQTDTAQTDTIAAEICRRMDRSTANTLVWIENADPANQPGSKLKTGAAVKITIQTPDQQVTGFFGPILNNVNLRSSVETRLEQDQTFAFTVAYPNTGTEHC